jgi:hypothetical protein
MLVTYFLSSARRLPLYSWCQEGLHIYIYIYIEREREREREGGTEVFYPLMYNIALCLYYVVIRIVMFYLSVIDA